MVKNYLKTAIRVLTKDKLFSTINVLGLGLGLAAFLVIYQYVSYERSFDQFHEKSENIQRLTLGRLSEGFAIGAKSSAVMGPILADNFAGIKSFVRLRKFPSLVSHEDLRIHEDHFYFTDSTFFNVFSFPLLQGDENDILKEPNTIVLTEDAANRIFGTTENLLGKHVRVDNQMTYRIDGIAANTPSNSHFKFDYLASITSIPNHYNVPLRTYQTNAWYATYFYTFLELENGVDVNTLGEAIETASKEYSPPENYELYGTNQGLYLQPLKDIHLNPEYGEIMPQGNADSLNILSIAAVFILLLAIINYANLCTAQSIKRVKEVALRKTLGARRTSLIAQFLGESLIVTFLGFALALSIVQIFQADLVSLLDLEPEVFYQVYGRLLPRLIMLFVLVGTLGGIYPAMHLSAFGVNELFRTAVGGKKSFRFRKGVILIQFVVSMSLISCTIVVFSQLNFMRDKDLGIDTEQVLILPTYGNEGIHDRYERFRTRLTEIPEVQASTLSELSPGDNPFGIIARFEGMESNGSFTTTGVDHDYVNTYGLEIIAGRDFSRKILTDTSERVLINRKLCRELGWSPEEAIGKSYDFGGDGVTPGNVIGVIEDFHLSSLKNRINPLVLTIFPDFYQKIAVKLRSGDLSRSIERVEETWSSIYPEWPFDYSLADQDFENQYIADQRFGDLFVIFTFLGLFIGALGIYGLIQLMAQYRMKELSIRKVLGANTFRLAQLLSKEYLVLLIASFVLSVPLIYYYINQWLAGFEYRISVKFWMVGVSFLVVLILCAGTIGRSVMKAVLSNPVDSLRQE